MGVAARPVWCDRYGGGKTANRGKELFRMIFSVRLDRSLFVDVEDAPPVEERIAQFWDMLKSCNLLPLGLPNTLGQSAWLLEPDVLCIKATLTKEEWDQVSCYPTVELVEDALFTKAETASAFDLPPRWVRALGPPDYVNQRSQQPGEIHYYKRERILSFIEANKEAIERDRASAPSAETRQLLREKMKARFANKAEEDVQWAESVELVDNLPPWPELTKSADRLLKSPTHKLSTQDRRFLHARDQFTNFQEIRRQKGFQQRSSKAKMILLARLREMMVEKYGKKRMTNPPDPYRGRDWSTPAPMFPSWTKDFGSRVKDDLTKK